VAAHLQPGLRRLTETSPAPLNLLWEIAQTLGLGAALACLLLSLLPVRLRMPGRITLSLARHELLGWVALGCVAGHVLLALASDPVVLEHLKVTTPLYEWAGIAALALLLFLCIPASAPLRRRLWSRHRSFQAAHVSASCTALLLIAVHVLTTGRYVHGMVARVTGVTLCAAALLALLRARARALEGPAPPSFPGRLVFGRHSRLVLVIVCLAVLGTTALLLPRASLRLREPLIERGERLVLDFPHDKHREVNCIVCHHNFTDGTGADACLTCHRSARTDLGAGAEARFHEFCLGCHRDPPPRFAHHGPVSACQTCHAAAHAP
jgi:predicted CXXCH cytochrome family protein